MRPSSTLRIFALLLSFIAVSVQAEEKRADEMPALTAKSIAVTPAYPQPEEPAVVVLTINNSANAPAEDVEVVFYANGTALASRTVTIGALSTATVSVPWSTKSAGTTTLVATIDPQQTLAESDRYDNTTVLDVVTSAAPAAEADFAVTAVDVLAPAEGAGSIRVVVGNEGKVSASAPLVIRRDGAAVTVVDTGVIEAGKSATIEVPWSDPDRGKISAEVNPRWSAAEPSSKNNTLAASAATEGVDLRIEQLAFHAMQAEKGQTRNIGVLFRIVNDGAQSVTKPFRTRIDPGAVDKDGKLVPAYITTAELPAGGTVYVSHIFESAPDDLTLTVDADIDNAVQEVDEKNNAVVKDFHDFGPDPDRWVNIGPRRLTGARNHGYGWSDATGVLSTMAIHPTQTATLYVGAHLSGVWRTTNSGASWFPLGESATVRVAALAIAPGNASRVFLVTLNDGVFRSDDAGTSWIQISPTDLAAVAFAGGGLFINPAAADEMVVASERGIFRSANGGVTWTQTLSGGACTSVVRMPVNGLLYAALRSEDPNTAGVYESFDWGAHWHSIRGCPGGPLPSADANTNIRLAASGSRLFVTYQGGNPVTFRLFRTTNLSCSFGGEGDYQFEAGWAPTGTIDGQSIPAILWSGLWADPSNSNNLYMTGTYFWRSTNAGSSFSATSTLGTSGSAHVDHHHVATDPATPSTIYSLDDGGIYRSTSRGASGSWAFIGDGIANVEFYDGVAAPTDAGLAIGGTQDNGTLKATAGNAVWTMIKDGDGATVDIDPANPSIMYAMHQYVDSISRSTNGGGSWSLITNGLPSGSQCFTLHYQVHPKQPATLLASCGRLWRTLSSGSSWSSFFAPDPQTVTHTAIDGPADLYYVGTNAGEISVMPGSGNTFRTIFQHRDRLLVTDLEVNPADPSRVYASFNGMGVRRIIRLVRNATTGNFTDQDITSDLPANRIVRTIAIDKNRPLTLYAGTDRGVFQGRSTNHGLTWFWRPYNNGMPPADVRDLEVHPTTGIMRAFTFGRSAYEVTTSSAPAGDVVAAKRAPKRPATGR
jgi:hypothetical protein